MLPSFACAIAVLAALALGYLGFFRAWQLRWGATDEEVERAMPGDALVGRPAFNATRGVTVQAPAEAIYPWIVQMGAGRAGWYSYDWLDHFGRPSAERLLPEFQHPQVGDVVPMIPGGSFGLRVDSLEPNRWIVWRDLAGDASWAWGVYPAGAGRCRLVTRLRLRYRLTWLLPAYLLVDVFDWVMMRRCLLGIRRRAETLSRSAVIHTP